MKPIKNNSDFTIIGYCWIHEQLMEPNSKKLYSSELLLILQRRRKITEASKKTKTNQV